MAVITGANALEIGPRRAVGNRFEKTFRITIGSQSATDEWIVTGFSSIDAVTGVATIQDSPVTANFVLNGSGTDATSGDNPGNLGVEIGAASGVIDVTVRGA